MKTPTPSLQTIQVVPPDETQVLPAHVRQAPPERPALPQPPRAEASQTAAVSGRAPRRPDERGKLFVRVLAARLDRLETAAFLERRTRQEIVDDALEEWLSSRGY